MLNTPHGQCVEADYAVPAAEHPRGSRSGCRSDPRSMAQPVVELADAAVEVVQFVLDGVEQFDRVQRRRFQGAGI